ncbi:hypothetical protein [Actinoalloteichus caeruleus]|uniref:Uncharacterized protein n=1 Tax=Actinoalloteichus caeruleus DSM 43889 TaxID=1120930 RepID=A0ABT1JG03_ACTCY|nr:hypothetical protein [Actinoalloteichus caeruleus]MCP2331096.1 hypothetical protein [Actinoalloteichus caeruleus DSM 43889]
MSQQSSPTRPRVDPTEFAADVLAAGGGTPAQPTSLPAALRGGRWVARPALLRRAAALLAPVLPAGVDRIVGVGPAEQPLVVATALHTGLPFAVLDDTTGDPAPAGDAGPSLLVGEVHRHETVVLVAAAPSPADHHAGEAMRSHGVRVPRTALLSEVLATAD